MNKLIAPDKFFKDQLKQLLSDIKKDEELGNYVPSERLKNYTVEAEVCLRPSDMAPTSDAAELHAHIAVLDLKIDNDALSVIGERSKGFERRTIYEHNGRILFNYENALWTEEELRNYLNRATSAPPKIGENMDTLSTLSQFPTPEMYKQLERDIANLSKTTATRNLEAWLATVPPGHDQRLANYGIKARRPAREDK